MNLNIADIRVNGGTQSRAGINRETVAEYAEAMQGGAVFPPLVVFHDGASYWLADGFHRYHAYAQINSHDVSADVRQGSQRDAILFSVGANASHGLRRTNDDKRRAVMVLLNDPEWSKWSDREIARQAGVSQPFVSKLRPVASDNGYQIDQRTVTRNGTTYQQNTTNIGGGSKDDQKTEPQQLQAKSPDPATSQAVASNDDQESSPEEHDPEAAKLRREVGKLTPEAMVDEIIGLRADLADEKAKTKAQRAEIQALKDENALLRQKDLGRALGNEKRRADAAEGRMKEHQANAARLQRQVNAQKSEIDRLKKEAENQVYQL